MAKGLLEHHPVAISRCVDFVVADTVNNWHGRGRAMMCRRLKHCPLQAGQADRLVATIVARLATGHFSEQFKDQLRLAMHLDLPTVVARAESALNSRRRHVRTYASWILATSGARRFLESGRTTHQSGSAPR